MFVHLNLHTEYSLLNGALRIADAIKTAKNTGMPAMAITDYGNIFGGVEFFDKADKAGIKPILGCEVFIPSYDDHTRREFRRGQDALWHLTLIVMNAEGYRNLSRLLTTAHLKGFYYKPRVDSRLLMEHNAGLIALAGGFAGEIAYRLYKQKPIEARAVAEKYATIFKDRFYLELQDNGLKVQADMNRGLMVLAQEMGLPLIATNHVHYLRREDAEAFEVLRNIQLARQWDSDLEPLKFTTDAYHLRSPQEMEELFAHCQQSLSATMEIAERCSFRFDTKYHFPKFEPPVGMTLDQMLANEAEHGLGERWDEIKLLSRKTDADRPAYESRLQLELDCIAKMGFSGYFLIVSDFIRWAKDRGIPVGPGRGSAAGSLVAYATRITDLDPIPYDLLFERFLNPERVSMPDVDVDFCQDRRSEVIRYVTEKYGNVSQIITFGTMKARAVVRDVGRVLEIPLEVTDRLAKLIPARAFDEDDGGAAKPVTLKDAIRQEPRLKEAYDSDPQIKRLLDVSMRLEGLSRHASVHPAGVIITGEPLSDLAPLYKGSHEDVVVQFDMKSAEKIGLIKFDFLGLKTLTVIHNTMRYVKERRGIAIAIEKIPMDDAEVFSALARGDGLGVFQLESTGMRELMARLKPSCFEDIIALVALYRPGPMDLIPEFIARKHGRAKVEYPDPALEPILQPTYGIMVYQEQVMQIAQVIAKFSLGEADLLRRAMGKKDAKEMARQRERFLKGATDNGVNVATAEKIFDLMAKFAKYGFNKSHSAAYGLVSYQTAWLKTHYYPEYMASLMTSEMHDTDLLIPLIAELKERAVTLLSPDINASVRDFSVTTDPRPDGRGNITAESSPKSSQIGALCSNPSIRYALCAIKGIGGAAVDAILEARLERPFSSYFDLCARVDMRRVSKKVLEMLIKCGALDGFGMPRRTLMETMEAVASAASRRNKAGRDGQGDLFATDDTNAELPTGVTADTRTEWMPAEKLGYEKESFGFYFSDHPLAPLSDTLKKLSTHALNDLARLSANTPVTVGGMLTGHRVIPTKKGDRMAFATLQDTGGAVELILFSRVYLKYREYVESDDPVLIKGAIDHSEKGVKIIVETMAKLSDALKQNTRSIHLDIPLQHLSAERITELMGILKKHAGGNPVFMHVQKTGEYETVLEMPPDVRVMACEPLRHQIDTLFDGKVVRFV